MNNDRVLRWASEYGHVEVVRYLIDAGVDVRARGDYALWAANGHVDVMKLLKKHGSVLV